MVWLLALPAAAETLRIATYNVELNRAGPGLLLRDVQKGEDPQIAAVVRAIAALNADVLVLTGFDYDLDQVALGAFADLLSTAGASYPYRFALRPNTGLVTGLDLNGDGYLGGAGDAQGYGRFSGEGGMAVLSRLPIDTARVRDFSDFLWKDLPDALLFEGMTPDAVALQRLSTTGHWEVPINLPDGSSLRLLVWYATPPVFDGPEDRNGRRNHDEAVFWAALLDGALPYPPPAAPFVILGDANLDPVDGDGLTSGINLLLAHPALQDAGPRADYLLPEPGHKGDAALDTADFSAHNGPGGLRVDYILPSADLLVAGSGVMWPGPTDPMAAVFATASRHYPVWVDVALPQGG